MRLEYQQTLNPALAFISTQPRHFDARVQQANHDRFKA